MNGWNRHQHSTPTVMPGVKECPDCGADIRAELKKFRKLRNYSPVCPGCAGRLIILKKEEVCRPELENVPEAVKQVSKSSGQPPVNSPKKSKGFISPGSQKSSKQVRVTGKC